METNRDKIIKDMGDNYWLGRYVKIHEISEYGFIEYKRYIDFNNKSLGVSDISNFSIYIDGKSISRGAITIDLAIIEAIAYKYDGANSHAANYFMKMIKPE